MGVSALGQLRESSPSINLIAIVRSKEEEERLKLDLCGAVLRDGKMETPRDMEKDLNIKVVVVEEDEEDEVDKLVGSMKSADTVDGGIMKGRDYLFQVAAQLNSVQKADALTVRAPSIPHARAQRRLQFEILASKLASPFRVLLRSTMGIQSIMGGDMEAVKRMGGEDVVAGNMVAEDSLITKIRGGTKVTVLRLGALVDGAGGVPIKFWNVNEEKEVMGVDKVTPIVSRNDAARVITSLIIGEEKDGESFTESTVVTASWDTRWGMSSAGTEEVMKRANVQDVVEDARETARRI